jgi:hypothetical protein
MMVADRTTSQPAYDIGNAGGDQFTVQVHVFLGDQLECTCVQEQRHKADQSHGSDITRLTGDQSPINICQKRKIQWRP